MMNPFIHSQLFLGRQRELERLRRNVAHGESTLLIGGRRAGKTRLLAQLDERDRAIARTDVGEWTLGDETLAIRAFGRALEVDCSTRDELFDAFRRAGPVALVIDEADRLLGEPWAAGLLAWMRWLIGPHGLGPQVAFVLAGGPVLSGYHNPEDNASPPLNLSERLYLRPLDRQACQAFIEVGGVGIDLEALIRKAGGHPWLLERILREVVDGQEFEEAVEMTFEHTHESFSVWRRQLGEDGVAFLRALPEEGVPWRAFSDDPAWTPHHTAMIRARHLCMIREGVVEQERRYLPGPALFLAWLRSAPAEPEWDLAISYASEDEPLAREITQGLRNEFRVFFAPEHDAWMWGKDLNRALPHVYGVQSRFVLVLSTAAYVRKHWTRIEFEAARAREGRLLVVNLGELPPDMPQDVVYREGSLVQTVRLLDVLREKLHPDD
ncbi:MAG TPA: TIR domain-containing protein [Thermoanaerobaculia bacterium]|jgi:hypothetical protein